MSVTAIKTLSGSLSSTLKAQMIYISQNCTTYNESVNFTNISLFSYFGSGIPYITYVFNFGSCSNTALTGQTLPFGT